MFATRDYLAREGDIYPQTAIAIMPSLFHESVVDLLEETVTCEVARATRRLRTRAGRKLAVELGRVYKGRSAAVDLSTSSCIRKQRPLRRQPDASWYHPSQPHVPTCLLEVSYSQPRRSLQRVARDYIQGANNAIRCVIGLDVPYPLHRVRCWSSLATLLIWRTSVYPCQSLNTRKRSMLTDSVKFYPTDFVPSAVLPRGSSVSALFEISLATIGSLVSDAEDRATAAERASPPITPPSTPRVFRKKHLSSGTERLCQPHIYSTPVKARNGPPTAPFTPVSTQKYSSTPQDAVMNEAGLWTPPSSQTKSGSMDSNAACLLARDVTPLRRSPRVRRFKHMI